MEWLGMLAELIGLTLIKILFAVLPYVMACAGIGILVALIWAAAAFGFVPVAVAILILIIWYLI